MVTRRLSMASAGSALAAALMLALGVSAPGGVAAQPPAARLVSQQSQPERLERRELLEALAALAGGPPRELRRLAGERGGLVPALESLGVDQRQILDVLTRQALRRFEPAIAEGRISEEQAEQLARQLARRLLRRLGGMAEQGR